MGLGKREIERNIRMQGLLRISVRVCVREGELSVPWEDITYLELAQ